MAKSKKQNDKEEKVASVQQLAPVSFGKLYTYATPLDKLLMIIGLITSVGAGAALPATSILFGNMITIMGEFQMGGSPDVFMENISLFATYFVYLGIGVLVCTYIYMACYIYVAERQIHRIREEYLRAVLHQNIAWFDDLGAGEVTTRITSDTNMVQDGIGEKVAIIFQDLATFVSGLVIAFTAEWRLALAVLTIVPVIVITAIVLNKFAGKYTTNGLNFYSAAGTLAEEVFSSIRTAVAFNQQKKLGKMYDDLIMKAEKEGRKKSITIGIGVAIIFFAIYCGYAIAFYYGGELINWGLIGSGKVVNVFFAILLGAFSLSNVPPHFQAVTYARGAGAKLFEAIDRVPPIRSNSKEGEKLSQIVGEIEFKNIRFAYPSRTEVQIFDDYSLKIEPGTTVALVGASGSGKSTTIQLLERFYDPDSGEVHLDGHNIAKLNLKWYRQQLGLVSQEPTLFSGTIADNVAIGLIGTKYEHAPREEQMPLIIEACIKSNANTFITGLPLGYDTQVGERGFLLSGGQKQRIAIARAIVKDPKVLLLDEATSALDTQSEGIVQEALDRASQGRTTIVIAHRLSTIKNADKIVVMERGRVLETGNHNELMARPNGAYRKLVEIQDIRRKKESAEVSEKVPEIDNDATEYVETVVETKDGKTEIVRVATTNSVLSVKSNIEEGVTSEFSNPLSELIMEIIKTNRPETNLILIGTFGSIVLGLIYPFFSIIFASLLDAFNQTGQKLLDDTAYWALMLFIIAIIAGIAQLCSQFGFAISSEKLSARLRMNSFNSILWQEIGWFDRDANSTGSLISALSQDAQDIQGFSGVTFGSILNIVVNLISSMIVGLVFGWKLALVVIACLPLILYSGYLRIAMIRNFQKKNKESYSKSADMACENAAAMRTVASLTKEDQICEQYHHALEEPLRAGYRNAVYSSFVFALSMSCNFYVNALAFWYGGTLMSTREYNVQTFFTVFMALIMGASGASRVFAYAPDMNKARDAAASIFYLIHRKPHIDSTEEGPGRKITSTSEKNESPIRGTLKFEGVHFHYPTRPGAKILKGIDFEVQPGQFVALVGPSGCGKSTSIGLLERFYDVSRGRVMIDGVDVRDYHLPSLRDNIALVGQEPSLYDLSIKDNIMFGARTYGALPTMDDVINAAKSANIHDFIVTLPNGYDTKVGGKGSQLSGGQKQRIAIARALVRNPSILLLDEATSALDAESEKVVQQALDKAAKGRTTLSIAHRLSTIQGADVILVLKDGHIVERGSHDELLSQQGVYFEMVQQQVLDEQNQD
ncbi:P-loop containing nucleoside triphosphate hydrolase protein [Neoconidiobolus thromboides FSU 785]|nr:P-loop containing nucleoside triphosphate hydrolase protein [Neoconidiobolus thromboides FSU 785]